jgi:hypothetical protein
MKTTLELPDDLVKEIKLRAVHEGVKLKDAVADLLRRGLAAGSLAGPAVLKTDKAMLNRRRALTRKFVSGEWGVGLTGYEPATATDRRSASRRARAWRG